MKEKSKKITALKKLLEIAKNRSIELHGTTGADHYRDARSWPVEWYENLKNGRFENEQDKQNSLNRILEDLVCADSPSSVAQLEKEKTLVRLVLDAGANPNYYYHFHNQDIFDDFLSHGKTHMALEIAKDDRFTRPGNVDKAFSHLGNSLNFYLHWKRPYPGNYWELDDKEKSSLYAQDCSDQKELVYILFQRGIYPHDEEVFCKLSTIILEKESDFFEKKKQQVVTQLARAKTPVQIFRAIRGRKEKSK